jgi:hypothetical protein
MTRHMRAALVEYSEADPPLALVFDINPQTLSRTRTVTLRTDNPPGNRGAAFSSPADVPLVAQGAMVQPETITVVVLLDATDRMMRGEPGAADLGVQPELDTLRSMLEPKTHGPAGKRVLTSLGASEGRAFERDRSASVLLFVWGAHVLPVFLTSVKVEERAHLPSLRPQRAEATLSMQVIEGQNPFYSAEQARQVAGASRTNDPAIQRAVQAVRE